ncbi:MAG: hypothetical protein M1829_005295 [Trizodia sp. TS-e1964]|nr:MAG: hypothetical protein M1829_005295 [Trizodia sp. TS-e1964]
MATEQAAQPSTTPALSFPRASFAKLSPRPFLLAHLQASSSANSPSLRSNGRRPSEFRTPLIHTGSLTHAHGSAVVRTGDTAAVCGVRAEILLASDVALPSSNLRALNLLVPNVELATGCSPAHVPGAAPSPLAAVLSARLLALLQSPGLLDLQALAITYAPRSSESVELARETKAYWTLYIDVVFISLDGNAFDVAWAAVLAALRDVRLPLAQWDADRERVLCERDVLKERRIQLDAFPVACTFAVFVGRSQGHEGQAEQAWILADPDTFEEDLCEELVTLVLDCGWEEPRLASVEKKGGAAVGMKEMKRLVGLSAEQWKVWRDVFASLSGKARDRR